jgi:Fe(3+) dicitrate transport protein
VERAPAAIRFGPNTVGGAINLLSRPIPEKLSGYVDLAGGMYWYGKAHGWVGASHGPFGILLEGAHVESDGFKQLDGGGDTGFGRNDVRLKLRAQSDPNDALYQSLEGVLGYETERSNETYLGLTDADFQANANRRYRASALDQMDWWRTNLRLTHSLAYEQSFDLKTTLYRNDFSRGWRKLNRFRDGPEIGDVLRDPSGRRVGFYDVLTGASDSTLAGEALMIGLNQRDFVSQGAQSAANARFTTGPVQHRPELGVRLHYDSIDRTHTEDAFLMTGGRLVAEGSPTLTNVVNTATALAFSSHLAYEIEFWRLTLTPGARLEVVHTELTDDLTGARTERTDSVVLPGAGAFFAVTDDFGFLAGAYEGFSPVSPGQPTNVKPEKSANYEAGARFQRGTTQLEAIGFYNDYSNLTGECGFSTGCDETLVGRQFNGGQVDVWGLELLLAHTFKVSDVRFPSKLSYTFTKSEFGTSFASENPEFGDVERGDSLPYVPEHQASLSLGVERDAWSTTVVSSYVGRMREQASQGDNALFTDDFLMVDVAAEHRLWDKARVYLRVDNLLGLDPIASRRPFGARPVKPLMAQVGLKVDF